MSGLNRLRKNSHEWNKAQNSNAKNALGAIREARDMSFYPPKWEVLPLPVSFSAACEDRTYRIVVVR